MTLPSSYPPNTNPHSPLPRSPSMKVSFPNNTSSPTTSQPTEPPPNITSQQYHCQKWSLPPGYKIMYHEHDGRMYYLDLSNNSTTWTHPYYNNPYNNNIIYNNTLGNQYLNNTTIPDNPYLAQRRPDSHQCCAFFSIPCFPLGFFALYHSIMVNKKWNNGRYGDSYEHSRQAYRYASWGVLFWVLILLVRISKTRDWKQGNWFDWDWG